MDVRSPDRRFEHAPAESGDPQIGAGQAGPKRTAYLTASLAQVNQTSRRVRLEQEVTIHTSDGIWLMSPTMYWLPDQNELITDQAVRLETDHMLLRGRGATGQTHLKHAVILRDVELVLNPTTDERAGERSHVKITCDGPLSFDYDHHVATFEQNVHVKDAQGDLYSDRLIAYLDPVNRTITYAEALGRVRIVQEANLASGERAVYEPAKGKVTLLGSPSLLIYPEKNQTPQLSAMRGVPTLSAVPDPGQTGASNAGQAGSTAQTGLISGQGLAATPPTTSRSSVSPPRDSALRQ